jgi:hypothetical protein
MFPDFPVATAVNPYAAAVAAIPKSALPMLRCSIELVRS